MRTCVWIIIIWYERIVIIVPTVDCRMLWQHVINTIIHVVFDDYNIFSWYELINVWFGRYFTKYSFPTVDIPYELTFSIIIVRSESSRVIVVSAW